MTSSQNSATRIFSRKRAPMATYTATAEGTQSVIDDIASRRRRLHFLKDRRESQDRCDQRADFRRDAYKAWGRSPSGALAESLIVPKEINLIWGWYSPSMKIKTKHDLVEVNMFIDQLSKASLFDSHEETVLFTQSIKKEDEGFVSFSEVCSSLAGVDVSMEHKSDLRHFARKLKTIKKEKKYEAALNGKSLSPLEHNAAMPMMKAKSESNVGSFPKLSPSNSKSSSVLLPNTKQSLRKASFSASRSPSATSQGAANSIIARNLSTKSSSKRHSLAHVDPKVAFGQHSPRSSGAHAHSGATLSLEVPPPPRRQLSDSSSPGSLAPLPMTTSCDTPSGGTVGNNFLPTLQPIAPLSSPSPRDTKPKKTVQLSTEATFSEDAPLSPVKTKRSPLKGILKGATSSPGDKVYKVEGEASGGQETPALQGVRKKFQRQLSRMNTRERLQLDEDEPMKSMGDSRRVNLDSNSVRQKRTSGGFSALTHPKADLEEDEDIPMHSLLASNAVDFSRNSFRKKRSDRNDGESAGKILKKVANASTFLNKIKIERTLSLRRGDSFQEISDKGKHESNRLELKPVGSGSGSGSGSDKDTTSPLSNLRRTFSRKLSKMSSFSGSVAPKSPKGSVSGSRSPQPKSSRASKDNHGKDNDSDDDDEDVSLASIGSFDSDGPDLLRVSNYSSFNGNSFEEQTIVRTCSTSSMDI